MSARPTVDSYTVSAAAEVAARTYNDIQQDFDSRPPSPLPGSCAHSDNLDFDSEAVRTVQAQAGIAIASASDHLGALLLTLGDPVRDFAAWTCARVVLETSAISLWLQDDKVDVVARVARSCCLRMTENQEQLAFLRSTGGDEDAVRKLETRRQFILETAKERGLHVDRTAKGKFWGFNGQHLPASTQLVAQELGDRWLYRAASGIVHGYSWSALHLSLTVGDSEPRMAKPGGTPPAVWLLLTTAFEGWLRAIHGRYVHFGWDREALVGSMERYWATVGLNRDQRFWHTTTKPATPSGP